MAWARTKGGVATTREAAWIWGAGFSMTIAGGVALSGNGERQERAVYASGLGVLAGAAAGWLVGSLGSSDDGPRVLAATLVGAGAGALLGGLVGGATYDASGGNSLPSLTVLSLRLPL